MPVPRLENNYRKEAVGQASDQRRELVVHLVHVVAETVQNAANWRHVEKRVHRQPHHVLQQMRMKDASGAQAAEVKGERSAENRKH